ncbi:MAG TPA: sugar kinase [Porphyromonadaceae bacterium]|nr:sugar kinase [Porphyromonadaceae bacterium]HBL33931.1 sugar kinase [Porphyromonadaceae bacterium]HBX19875.1 sugar kinase [Porphyromonadaceae bacterium]HBX44997.1 sugar kinase [Porphyromonadaceae bacterium]HCM20271.1 sugar kinase [Porphyromonadaceae bacterium]
MKHLIGIDIGGTTIKGGLVKDRDLIKQTVRDTEADKGGEITLMILEEIIDRLKTVETTGIGIGVPSVVDSAQGIVYHVQNIRNWEEVHLKSILEEKFGLPVFINNDANCFAMGERIYGLGRQFENFVGITLGTGVGGGIIQRGRLLADANCGSGEYGEMPYHGGKLEEYCGSFFFTKKNTTGREIAFKAEKGDQAAIEIMNEYGKHVAALVKMVVLSVDPQAIIFGGAISNSLHLFKEAMYRNLTDFPFPNSIKKLSILKSELQNIGILGAAALCYEL